MCPIIYDHLVYFTVGSSMVFWLIKTDNASLKPAPALSYRCSHQWLAQGNNTLDHNNKKQLVLKNLAFSTAIPMIVH